MWGLQYYLLSHLYDTTDYADLISQIPRNNRKMKSEFNKINVSTNITRGKMG